MEYDKDEELDNFAMDDEYSIEVEEEEFDEDNVGEFAMETAETKLSTEKAGKISLEGGDDEFLDGDAFTMEDDPNNTLEEEYEMAMATGVHNERRRRRKRPIVENHMWLLDRPTTPTNVLVDRYQEAQMTKSDDGGSKSDQPDGNDEKSLHQLWAKIALKHVRMKKKTDPKSAPIRPSCEMGKYYYYLLCLFVICLFLLSATVLAIVRCKPLTPFLLVPSRRSISSLPLLHLHPPTLTSLKKCFMQEVGRNTFPCFCQQVLSVLFFMTTLTLTDLQSRKVT
jgi:hypothetical protein